MPFKPAVIDAHWQEWWERERTFQVSEDTRRPKFYALDMFPYPSGRGLHVGHTAGYIPLDVVCRYKRAAGFNVLHAMGWDAFGLPAEQKAIDEGVPPKSSTAEAIVQFRKQCQALGLSYDWSREFSTADPEYYKWTQFIFTRLYERGLAYQSDVFVNWCPELGTVLANDEVIDGKSERGGHPVFRRKMRQWMLRITRFADRLLEGLEHLNWPEATKKRQREWIGKSAGAEVTFPVVGSPERVEVFTTRPDTLWGATYLVLAPEHPLVGTVTTEAQREVVIAYQRQAASRSDVDRQEAKIKTGVDTGARATNPVNGQELPVWIADYVIGGYGTGAIMAVPGHDTRDWEFAKALGLPIVEVVTGGDVSREAHAGDGVLVRSGPFDGTPTADGVAVRKVIEWLEEQGLGKGTITFHLRDWIFARQRYWGEPIPVLKDGGEVVRALTLDELPVVLPDVEDYRPSGTGQSPLARARQWVEVDDPITGRKLQREVDTMPGSAASSWYFLRFCDAHNAAAFCARDKSDYWMPVDLYLGGAEHTVGHLLYARMWQMFLHDEGLARDAEPFHRLLHPGMIQGEVYYDPEGRIVPLTEVETKGGGYFRKGSGAELLRRVEKMSKRKGNVVNPMDLLREVGADAFRVYMCFIGPLDLDKPWQTQGMEGQFSWLRRVWRLFFEEADDAPRVLDVAPSEPELRILHKALKKVTSDIEALSLNTAVSALHIATRDLAAQGTRSRAILEPLAQLLAPLAPHLAEEIWAKGLGHGGGIVDVPWPKLQPQYAQDELVTIGVQIQGKSVASILLPVDADETYAVALARADPAVVRRLEGRDIKKVIYKAGRILNLVLG